MYHLLAADLRDLPALETGLRDCGVDFACPTLFLSECVMVYMPPAASKALVAWAAASFSRAAWLNYEPIRPDDAFGRIMVDNLRVRRGAW